MSTILAMDTSSEGCSVAILQDGAVSAKYLAAPRQHTQLLLPMVDEMLSSAGLTLNQVDAIAYGRGPGSFTGLRICLGIAQGLGFAAERQLVGVSSLETMACEAVFRHRLPAGERLLVAIDARMDEVYWCVYQVTADGIESLSEETLSPPQMVAEYLQDTPALALKVGSGCHYQPLVGLESTVTDLVQQPKAEFMLGLAEAALSRGETVAAEQARLTYLRDSVAWQKRERIRNTRD
ncbi:tRNA (adenosine(37)-N6)-threonylcarbamoyltransferase complex dimerization subunit type 1 TsaB [Pseudomaricurvus sp. HS19]|uniref:tRNA (adenosine(37)-N6)-threonylcarbamoyltransferase complex dimerization subunit type 1 TsaB n=1 Tax=Pseudomaricurvus sp. HS19 TaxID=2692626 RepID=UPI0013721870|nr:tRNA (adenosine(37)-N6)-threonylcarbamoyltransferase complex dimerization subunit type 1 TsaB [Pseudomaricurvus sp. HS19]MYM62561.1 tRNA (adenosine(37)-N6)-threonylcarbamoyltransferase complex dimerization subunit type 1 TsaB [Pseudomaricurvus sp. HS19]